MRVYARLCNELIQYAAFDMQINGKVINVFVIHVLLPP